MNLRAPRQLAFWLILTCLMFASSVLLDHQIVSAAPKKKTTVTLIIEFGEKGKTKKFDQIAWKQKMTVLDAMNAVKGKSPGIKFTYRGKGAFALLTEIDGTKGEGAGGLNWLYRVNGKLADRGFAVYVLRAGDRVVWKLGKYP